jgi:hypothetical protein
LGDSNIEAIEQMLNRLTPDEARNAAGKTLKIVHGLLRNMRVFIDSGLTYLAFNPPFVEYSSILDGKASIDGIREALSTLLLYQREARSASHGALEMLHKLTSKKNKSKR